jgi:hypothetical protein
MKSGATLPGDVATGKFSMSSPEAAGRVADMTGLVTGGAGAEEAPAGALRAGAARAAQSPTDQLVEALCSAQADIRGGKSLVAFNPETRSWGLADRVPGALPTDAPLLNGGRGAGLPPVPQTDPARQVPARGVPQRTLYITSNPDIRQQMMGYIRRGLQMSGDNWYDTTTSKSQSQIDVFIRAQQPLLGVAGAGAVAAPFAYGAVQQPQPFPPAPGPVQFQ